MAGMLVYGLSDLTGVAVALEAFRALPPERQRPAPAFTLPDHQGAPINLADLRGKVVVVRFWATWWHTCVDEMPSVQKAHELFRDQDVAVLTISIDGQGERAVGPFMTAHGYTFPSLVDQRMDVARKFGIRLVPTTYVVNREGVIVGAGYGPVNLAGPMFADFLIAVLSASWPRWQWFEWDTERCPLWSDVVR
jgi:peroxiredoxin